jgi:GNAT superfamily N-acetyltransferase
MRLPDGYLDLPLGKIAAVQTFLEMRKPAAVRPEAPGIDATLRRVRVPDPDWYLRLFHRVGDRYLWFSRLEMSRETLRSIIQDPSEEVYAVDWRGGEEGLLELDFRTPGQCEIAYLGLTPALVGTGVGRWLMNRAIEIAWSKPISRFWVHTCSLDHPAALDYYIRSGFVPYQRKIEIADDPRQRGLVPRDAAPQIPLISTENTKT